MPTELQHSVSTYSTLEEIRLRKEQLSEEINQDEELIGAIWHELFKNPDESSKGEYIATLVSHAVTAIDAFLLVRKLIRNYNSVLSFFGMDKKRRRKS